MSTHEPITSDGPDAVLQRLATQLKLPYGGADIVRMVAAHPRPNSLLALIDVARQLGIELKPGKADAAALAQIETPFIAHFNGANGGGFALVEGRTASGFELWDSGHEARSVDEETFATQWSGVIALVDSVEGSTSSAGFLGRKVAEKIGGGQEPPSIAAGPGAWALRALLGAILTASLGSALSAHPIPLRLPLVATAVLALAGLFVASVMTVAISSYGGPFAPGICGRGRLVDCQSVLTSRFAKIAGFSLSDIGIAFYGAVLLVVAISGLSASRGLIAVVGLAFVAAIGAAVVLTGIQIAMRKFCTLCLAAHAINVAGAVVAWRSLLPDAPRVSDLGSETLLFALAFCLVLFFAVPYLKKDAVLRNLTESYSRMSLSPFGSLAQLTTERPTGLVGSECGIPLNDSDARDELVAFLHPGCSQCEPVLREIVGLAGKAPLRLFVALPPKGARERALCEAVIAGGLAAGPNGFIQTFGVAKQRFAEFTRTSADIDLGVDPAALPQARPLVARAEEFAEQHVEGTPALFFNSLPFKGPVAHLVTLVERYADLLPRPAPR